jgi:hypothetical protein
MNQSLVSFTAGMGAVVFVAKLAHRHELAPVREKTQRLPERPDSNH